MEAEKTIEALGDGRFRTCLSANILSIYQKCEVVPEDNVDYISDTTGEIDISSLPHNIQPDSPRFYAIYNQLCRQSWNHWRHRIDGETSKFQKVLDDSSSVIFLCLQHSTLLEKGILSLVGEGAAMLLKDALQDTRLSAHFPPLFIHILTFLFVPNGLNFRNIIWHGFVAPSEVNPIFCSLLLSLHTTVALLSTKILRTPEKKRKISLPPSPLAKEMFQGFEAITQPFSLLNFGFLISCDVTGVESTSLLNFLESSFFVLPGREQLVLSAIIDHSRGKHVTCLMKIIPCLEHSLRLLFCLSNNLQAYIMADVDVYYSTLDGFGQRSKHQLLLDPYIFKYDREKGTSKCLGRNKLLSTLGEGLYALLVDLFFAETGPNVRARLAHGINITYDEEDDDDDANNYSDDSEGVIPCNVNTDKPSCQGISNVVLALYLSMCMKFYRHELSSDVVRGFRQSSFHEFDTTVAACDATCSESQSARSFIHLHEGQKCRIICEQWQSLYHPHRGLARVVQRELVPSLHQLAVLIQHRNFICVSRCAPESSADHDSDYTAKSGMFLIEIFHQRVSLSSSEEICCQQLICAFSDKESRIFSNFLCVATTDTQASSYVRRSLQTASGAPGGDLVREQRRTQSVCTLSHDVIQSCNTLNQLLFTALGQTYDVAGTRVEPEPELKSLTSLHKSLLSWNQPLISCHECTEGCCSDNTTVEIKREQIDIRLFISLLDQFLSRYCSTSSLPIQGMPCCFSILNVRDIIRTVCVLICFFVLYSWINVYPFIDFLCCSCVNCISAQQLSELCSKLHTSIQQKENLLICTKSHTGDRRQYLLQLLCLAPGKGGK